MKRIIIALILVCIVCSQDLVAQYDAQLSNYWAAMSQFNPAAAGQTQNLEVTALNRMQWVDVSGAPVTMLVAGSMPLELMGRMHGVGAQMFTEKIGLFSHTIVSAQYAYKKDMLKGKFSLGLQVGYINESFQGSKIHVPTDDYHQPQDDAIPTVDISGTSIDAAFGAFYSNKKMHVGLSVTHLLAPQLLLDENYVLEIPRAYYFTAGYNIQLNNPLLELRPTLLVKTTEMGSYYMDTDSLIKEAKANTMKAMMSNTQIDLTVRMIYNKQYYGGLGWRKDDAAVLLLGGKFKMIEVGYSYDFPISQMRKGSTGSHELYLKLAIDMGGRKKVKNKHKSVRIL